MIAAMLAAGGRRPQSWSGQIVAIDFESQTVSFRHDECFFDSCAGESCACHKANTIRFGECGDNFFDSDWESALTLRTGVTGNLELDENG